MTYSYTYSETATFTLTHAKHLAAKVATDLKRLQRLYGVPSDKDIADYELEVTLMLQKGYLDSVTYGFYRNGSWIEPMLRYTAKDLDSSSANDDDPGGIRPNADISGANFWSYMTYSSEWYNTSDSDKDELILQLPFRRVGASEPGINGYLSNDRTYSSGGRALNRSSVRSY